MKRAGSLGLLALCAAGCRAPERVDAPVAETPAGWSEVEGDRLGEPEARWWERFGDPVLDRLVQRALAQNLDVEAARARVLEARALRDVARGGGGVELDASASAARAKASESTPQGRFTDGEAHDLFDAGFDARWEADLFGSRSNRIAAAEAGIEAAELGRRETLVSLVGELARNYVELRGLQRRAAITQANLDTQRDTALLVSSRFKAGMATGLDEARAQALSDATSASIPALHSRTRAAIHRIALLCGEAPGALVSELERPVDPPVPPKDVTVGLPADLVRRRPDVARAERELAVSLHLTAAARADLYPRISLAASLGFSSEKLSDLLDGDSLRWSAGGGVLAPILNGGTLRAAVRVEEARVERARATWKQSVLAALVEVEDELSGLRYEEERHAALAAALESNRRAAVLARALQERGLADYLDVLDAERSLLAAESEEVDSTTALASRTVALYKALGGL